MNLIKKVFDYKGAPVLMLGFAVLLVLESKHQLRRRKQPKLVRAFTNAIVSIPAFSLLRFVLLPLMVKLAIKNQQLKWGLNYHYQASPFFKSLFTFLLLDYSNYLWHMLNHKLPVLWRFHVVHHSDPDLDVTTALRFHFGEMIGSVFYRGACVLLSGASPLDVLRYEILFEGATQFHHSNMRLPVSTERMLSKIIVTPRMHGIHHSMVKCETDSNYAVIFSWWDRLHNTIKLHIKQDKIITGVPTYANPDELTIGFLLKLPFTKIRKWNKDDNIGEAGRLAPGKFELAE